MDDKAWTGKVFRLEGIPSHVNTLEGVARLLCEGFTGFSSHDISVRSLATSLHHWTRPAPRVATLQFQSVPSEVRLMDPKLGGTTWDLSNCRGCEGLTLDSGFLGLTPLNDVNKDVHMFDCIAISGLASHPFGSWQPHGRDKTFMWIRDEAPSQVPGMRTILYGYSSSLVDSESTLALGDIAKDLIENLGVGGWRQPSAKPLVFLAHSLGGSILKDFFVRIADARDVLNRDIIDRIRGAVMFGVPNFGMDQSHLLAIVEGQPNESLVQDLKPNSNYLLKMDKAFTGTSFLNQVAIFWAYETRLSPTVVQKPDGTGWMRNGPASLLVDPYSATCRLEQKDPSRTFPIPENHSDMVKFTRNSPTSRIVYSKLRDISNIVSNSRRRRFVGSGMNTLENAGRIARGLASDIERERSKKGVLASLDAPDLNLRLKLIERRYEGTFEWIYKYGAFTSWLHNGTGIFWIHGKPGSGKSTLMRFIFEDRRTLQYITGRRAARSILAGFFFYYRGTSIQKSIEGLLRSIISHIIKDHGDFPIHKLLYPIFLNGGDEWRIPTWTMSELMYAFQLIFEQNTYQFQVCLFLDALDEFDGPHLVICQFLSDLLKMSSKFANKVSICFSSRPEEAFKEHFGSYWPHFSLQNYTTKDIRNYCLGVMASSPALSSSAAALVPEIIERASGVFLWVKLVIKDLDRAAASESKSLTELRNGLRDLPLDLSEYYGEIIKRIPSDCRWETYVLLDLIIRASEISYWKTSPRLTYIWKAISVSSCHTYAQARGVLESLPVAESERDALGLSLRKSQEILTWGGGLVEIYCDEDGFNCLQVMHQTIFEFVTSLKFKETVLGHLAKGIYENGHIFHSKYLLASLSSSEVEVQVLASHARAAEKSSGSTLVEFTTGMKDDLFRSVMSRLSSLRFQDKDDDLGGGQTPAPCRFSKPLDFAAFSSLILFLQEWTDTRNGTWQQDNTTPLLWFTLLGSRELGHDDFAESMTLLLNKGYRLVTKINEGHGDLNAIASLLLMVRKIDIRALEFRDKLQKLTDLLLLLFRSLGPASEMGRYRVLARPVSNGDYSLGWCTFLHLSTSAFATHLLDSGMDPNCVDARGFTPLDACLNASVSQITKISDLVTSGWISWSYQKNKWTPVTFSIIEVYELACLLTQRGGRLATADPVKISYIFDAFMVFGWDILVFQDVVLEYPGAISLVDRFSRVSGSNDALMGLNTEQSQEQTRVKTQVETRAETRAEAQEESMRDSRTKDREKENINRHVRLRDRSSNPLKRLMRTFRRN